jgi:chromatin assembly factor 1 subunit A
MKPPNTTLSNNKSVKPFFTPASELSSQPSTSQQPSFFLPPPSSISSPGKSKPGPKPKKLISEQDMPAFKAAIEGSDLSKVGLIEVLKKKFPGRSGAAIKGTLEVVARRVGQKEVDKRWVVLSGSGT